MSATVTTAGIGLFLLIIAWLRTRSLITIFLAVMGVTLLGSGILDKVSHTVSGLVATVLNSVGGAL